MPQLNWGKTPCESHEEGTVLCHCGYVSQEVAFNIEMRRRREKKKRKGTYGRQEESNRSYRA